MLKCIHDQCQWPECDKTCGLVPTGGYIAGSSAEEKLILHLQNEIAELLATLDSTKFHLGRAINNICSELTIIESDLPAINEYIPSCPHGYCDCVYDPAYIRKHYPDWWKDLGMPTSCKNCPDGERYDDEDK